MTENLLEKLEEKMMALLTEVEDLRKDVLRLNHENHSLKAEKDNNSKKLTDLISLLDTVQGVDSNVTNIGVMVGKPVFVHDGAARE